MLAARLFAEEPRLRLVDVPVPEPFREEVLVQVAGCGVCRSDLHILDGLFPELVRPPVTLGHEIAGRVAALGPDVDGLVEGAGVAVMVGWGCGSCALCISGAEHLCANGDEAGATKDGGFAEYVLVPHGRFLVPLGELDPIEATPLGCAGITARAAIRRAQPVLTGAATLVVIGAGGLGQYAIQLAQVLTEARVVAVDAAEPRRRRAAQLGATAVGAGDALAEIRELTQGRGAEAVLDFVGTDETLALAGEVVATRGIVALIGLAGGRVPFHFFGTAPEATLTTVVAGSIRDLEDVVELARSGRLESEIDQYPLSSIHAALDDLRGGRIAGRAVLVPRVEEAA
jgi:propanol-preferring alcohol dehydrogenase